MKERVYKWDNAKAFLIFFVVYGHFANEYTADDVTMLYQSLYNVNIHIDLRGIIFAATLIGALASGPVIDPDVSTTHIILRSLPSR